MGRYFKLAKESGWDFWTGNTINYRDNIGGVVRPPKADSHGALCTNSFVHASDEPNKCFVGATIPCSAYIVEGEPIASDEEKCGFVELSVISEITDLDKLFGWNYTEACNPTHPFKLTAKRVMTDERIALLQEWNSVRASVMASVRASVRNSVGNSVWDSVWDSVWNSIGDSVGNSVWDSVWDSVRNSVWNSVRDSVWDSVRNSVWNSVYGYIGSLFPCVPDWQCIDHESAVYPYQPVVDLWKQGIVPSFDGTLWRLHSGRKASVIWEGVL